MPYGRRHVVSWKGAMTAFFAIVLTILWLHLARILEAAPTPVTPISGVFADDSWIQYVRAPTSMTVLPRTVLPQLIKGNVTNPNGLITGDGPTTFSRLTASDPTPEIVVDFGTNTVGLVSIDFVGAYNLSEGLPGIRLAFSETLEYLTNDSDFSRSYNGDTITPGSDQIAVKPDPYTWTDFNGCEYGGQVCADGLHGFRYLRIYLDTLVSDAPYTSTLGSVSVQNITLALSAFHGTPDTFTGWFECSDANITQWWYDAAYTNELNTDVFLANETDPRNASSSSLTGKTVLFDGAKRDRDPYVGDLAVSALTTYLTHNISEAAMNVLADLAEHQRSDGWIPPASIDGYTLPLLDYPLWWVVCSYDYVMYTGNVSYIQTYYQNLVALLDGFYPGITNPATGLIEKGRNGTSSYGDYAFLPRSGPVTYYNALYVHALNFAAVLANGLSQPSDSARWMDRASAVSKSLASLNFDVAVGAFYDGTCGNTSFCDAHAQDGNSIAVLAGVANATLASSILNYYASAAARPYGNAFYDSDAVGGGFSQRVYAFLSYFEIAARLRTPGLAASAFDEMRRLYGWMASNDPGVTFWEGIGENGTLYEGAYTSMAHGWSTGIVPLLSNYVLGVTPTTPGFKTWQLKPVTGDLSWARGVVPTPDGGIGVWWTRAANSSFALTVSAPALTRGVVLVPATATQSVVRVNGQVVLDKDGFPKGGAAFTDGFISVGVQGGTSTVLVDN